MRRSLMTVLCLSFLSLGILVRGGAAQPAALTVTSTPPTGLSITSSTADGSTTPYTVPSLAYGASVNLVAPATDPPGYTFSQWTLNTSPGSYPLGQKSITFAMMGFAITATANYTASAAPPSKLAFVQGPTGTTAGTAISPPVTVAVEDSGGNVLTTDNTSNVTLSLVQVSGSGTLNGGTQTMAASSGVATFTNLIVSAPGTYQLQATDNGDLPSETFNSATFTITGSAGGAAKLVYVQPPTGALAGATITPAVTIAVEDANGNVITTDSSSSITVFLGPSSSGQGTLSGTLTGTAVNGVATFSNLSISLEGSYSLWAIDNTNGSVLPATSSLFNIVSDTTPPIVYGQIPVPGGYAADGLTPIELQIVAASSGLNLSTVRIQAERNLGTAETICDGSNLNPAAPASYPASIAGPYQGYYDATANGNTTFKGRTYIYGTTPQDTRFVFEPDTDAAYDFEETVNVVVTATDWAGNAMVFSFTTPPVSVYQFAVDTRSPGWDVQVDGGASGNNNPATATSTDANGNSIIWVVWERPDPTTQKGTIWLAKRTDDATNFDSEIQVTTVAANGNCHTPSIAITADGTIYVAYEVLTGIPVDRANQCGRSRELDYGGADNLELFRPGDRHRFLHAQYVAADHVRQLDQHALHGRSRPRPQLGRGGDRHGYRSAAQRDHRAELDLDGGHDQRQQPDQPGHRPGRQRHRLCRLDEPGEQRLRHFRRGFLHRLCDPQPGHQRRQRRLPDDRHRGERQRAALRLGDRRRYVERDHPICGHHHRRRLAGDSFYGRYEQERAGWNQRHQLRELPQVGRRRLWRDRPHIRRLAGRASVVGSRRDGHHVRRGE